MRVIKKERYPLAHFVDNASAYKKTVQFIRATVYIYYGKS